ncbi:hypothetical protein BJV78DRAFT_1350414 [Lactifluus subvellereus]|nr:hypothetical protein BJV78DRAFT_1350414 [Lactifluus subvellereus]
MCKCRIRALLLLKFVLAIQLMGTARIGVGKKCHDVRKDVCDALNDSIQIICSKSNLKFQDQGPVSVMFAQGQRQQLPVTHPLERIRTWTLGPDWWPETNRVDHLCDCDRDFVSGFIRGSEHNAQSILVGHRRERKLRDRASQDVPPL